MGAVVIGAGRSGTNIVLEILRASPELKASREPENRKLFREKRMYPETYLTKCDTCRMTYGGFKRLLNWNQHIKVIWTIRDPRDMIMSKLKRGVPLEAGGDCRGFADDSTIEGAIADLRSMTDHYKDAIEHFGDRTKLWKMEDVLKHTEKETMRLCEFVGIEYHPKMCEFWKNMRDGKKRKRYHSKDMSQIAMWKNWRTAYDGWLKDRGFELGPVFEKIKDIVEFWKYD